LRFAQEGPDIVIPDIDLPKAYSVAEEIKPLGRKAILVKVDVSRFSEAKRMVRQAIAEFAKVDILVNNAGTNIRSVLSEMTEQDWDRVLGINLKGCFNCSLFVASVVSLK
jgi:NAD(P)-dependent dehydrogenase (short-subunit alcohol dehydrogenase family)